MIIQCRKCFKPFDEAQVQLSHDIPRYIGGTDQDGRHYLCIKCHDIYERMVFAAMTRPLPGETKDIMRNTAKSFAKNYFKRWHDKQTNS